GRGWVTLLLLGASIAVAVRSQLGASWPGYADLLLTNFPPSAGLPELRAGQIWRLFTPITIHFGFMHLGFNLSMWWTWAQRIEGHKGAAFFGTFVLAAAATTNLAEHAWGLLTAPYALRAVGGLSGVLYALFGYGWRKQQIDPHAAMVVDPGTVQWMLGWLVLCMTGLLGSVANVAHVSGLLIGVAWAHVDQAWFQWQKRR
ncbi:MAG TPA: rhomboid family intramembrane serine protease, partial [Myxococcota bacterium]|nr:rhomboid family intramembrane serine protease [Myxococcota bacterium]